MNGDAKPDLVTVDEESDSISVLLGRGDRSFRKRLVLDTAWDPVNIASADVDADGDPDLITARADDAGSIAYGQQRRADRR